MFTYLPRPAAETQRDRKTKRSNKDIKREIKM